MSKRLVSRIILASLLLVAGGSASFALANGDALTALRGDVLAPSDSPALLGPIDEHGRTGWECKPEKAAASSNATMGELPQATR